MLDLSKLPNNPGCYLFKNNAKKIIYIGKAKNLKKRASSYFQKKGLDPKTQSLVKNIDSVDFIATNNEVEALILENTLIKKHKPKYNIDLKDSKRYAWLQITDEAFPRLITARKKTKEGQFFGPFTSGFERENLRVFLTKIFKIRTCKKMPKKPCLRYHINLCDAPCVNYITREEYSMLIENVKLVLKGKTKDLITRLNIKMREDSMSERFEKAIEKREQITALNNLKEKQNMERDRKYDEDIINYIIQGDKVYLLLFNIYKGTLTNKTEFVFDYMRGFLEDFLKQYYDTKKIPKEIIVSSKVDPAIQVFLQKKSGKKVTIIVPKIGEKKILLELVKKNIELSFFADLKKLEEVKDKLKLMDTPHVIECFDISHISGTSTVGSMVQFREGRPDKSNYRRFKIRSVVGVDDFRSIGEVVRRRYNRLKDELGVMPNLIIIDGGKGQLKFAIDELRKLELKIPIISIAKRFEEIYVPGMSIPIRLDRKSAALRFIQEIRDEAHRFAIKYNRLLRGKKLKE